MAENTGRQVALGPRKASPQSASTDVGQLKDSIGQTRGRMAASLDSLGGRLSPWLPSARPAEPDSWSTRTLGNDSIASTAAAVVAIRKFAPLVRAAFTRAPLGMTMLGVGALVGVGAFLALRAATRAAADRPSRARIREAVPTLVGRVVK